MLIVEKGGGGTVLMENGKIDSFVIKWARQCDFLSKSDTFKVSLRDYSHPQAALFRPRRPLFLCANCALLRRQQFVGQRK